MFFQSHSCLWYECTQLAGRYYELQLVVDMSERAVPGVSEVSVDVGLVWSADSWSFAFLVCKDG